MPQDNLTNSARWATAGSRLSLRLRLAAANAGGRLARLFGAMSLARLLTLIVLATALPLLLASYVSFKRLSDHERLAAENSLMLSTRILSGLVDNEIDTHDAVVKTLSQSRALERGDLGAFWDEASRAMKILPGAWMSVSDPQGQLLMSTLVPFGAPLPPRREPAELLRAVGERNGLVSNLRQSLVSSKLVAFLDFAVMDGGKLKYVLSMSLVPQRFYELFKNRFNDGELLGILDRSGRFIARIPDNDDRLGKLASEDWRAAVDREREGIVYNRTLEGARAVTAFTTSAHGWTVGIAQPESAVVAPLHSAWESTVWMVLFLTTLSITLATLIARYASNGMAQLADAAAALGDGRPVPELAAPFREADAIARALRDASAEVAHAQADLEVRVNERTDELRAEMHRREQSEAQNQQLLRMQAIGQLTGGIAHDFNNMLAVVIASLSLLKRRLAAGRTDVDEFITGGIEGAQRAAALTKRLLAFARQQPLSPEPLDVNKLVANLGDLIPRTIGESIRVETVLAAGLWTVNGDSSQLENAILNLAVNARDAMADGGNLTIETANCFLDEEYVRGYPDVASGQYVQIAVTDSGVGMCADGIARAFEPFYTTKPPGAGTGLGLSQVYGFVKQSHGHVKIYSERGHGTTVKIYLPRYMGSVEPAAPRVAAPAVAERSSTAECVLVVEDEARVRHLSVETLRELGYRVLEADGAAAALDHIKADRDIVLLFADIVMPEVNGRKLAEQALVLNPKLKVLYTTGFTRNAVIHNGTLDRGVALIAKPFTIEALARKVREVLDR